MSSIFRGGYRKILKLVRKPPKEEYKLTLKVVLLGLGILGSIGYIFQLIGSAFQFAQVGIIPRDIAIIVIAVIAAIVMGITAYMARKRL